jgi:glycerol-3-phosphate dehydrogenase subunit B
MRVAVIGGGLAGCAAALELRARGAEVTLIRRAPGATALIGGTLDVAGASPLRRGSLPLCDPQSGVPLSPAGRLHAVGHLQPGHPYAGLFRGHAPEAEVKEAVAALDGWIAPSGLRVLGNLERTRWLVDLRGALRAADLVLTGPGEGDVAEAPEVVLVAFPGLEGWDASAALATLAAELAAVGLPARPLRLLGSGSLAPLVAAARGSPARLARHIDSDAGLDALRRALAPLGGEGRLLLLPPVLGLERTAAALDALREAAGCGVAEVVGAIPFAVAGYRLDRALCAALVRAGVALHTGRAAGVETLARRATAIRVEAADRAGRVETDALVLATGRFVGGGLRDRDGQLREELLDLPLFDLGDRRVDGLAPHALTRRDYEGEQPLFAAGVRTDERLRPLGEDGLPRLENLFAAGDLLGSFDPARDRTGIGVALLSGRRAGAEASRGAAEGGPC